MKDCLECKINNTDFSSAKLSPEFYDRKWEHNYIWDSETCTLYIYCHSLEIAQQAVDKRFLLATWAQGIGAETVIIKVGNDEKTGREFIRFSPSFVIKAHDRFRLLGYGS
jgi:hypothetical protein